MTTDKVTLIRNVSFKLLTALVALVAVLLLLLGLSPMIFGRFLLLPVVLLIGSIAGFISLQRRLKTFSEEDLQLISTSIPYTWLSPVVGGLLAVILYLMFLGDLLGGDLFPKFVLDPHAPTDIPGFAKLFHMYSENPKDYAKLLVWSFIAGLSESFVVDVIGQFEKKVR